MKKSKKTDKKTDNAGDFCIRNGCYFSSKREKGQRILCPLSNFGLCGIYTVLFLYDIVHSNAVFLVLAEGAAFGKCDSARAYVALGYVGSAVFKEICILNTLVKHDGSGASAVVVYVERVCGVGIRSAVNVNESGCFLKKTTQKFSTKHRRYKSKLKDPTIER